MTRELVFHGAQSLTALLTTLSVVGVVVALIVLLSRYERTLVPRSVGIWLLGLRLAVLAVILMTLLQPVLSWTRDEKKTGRLLVAIDVSDSMSLPDIHASRAEKLRWARGLEMIGNQATRDRLDRWQQSLEAGQEPDWVDAAEVANEERRAVLAASRRDQLLGLFRDLNQLSRREIARRLLSTGSKPLIGELKRLGNVDLLLFAGKTESITDERLEQAVANPGHAVVPETTNLTVPLQAAISQTGGNLMGVILFTDGRDHGGQNPAPLAAVLKSSHVPIYPVLIGSVHRPKDLSFGAIEHPLVVYKDEQPRLKATLNTSGFEGQSIDVELLREDRPDEPPLKQTIVPNGPTATVEFDLDGTEVGRKAYVIRTPGREGETREDNNSRSFALSVVDNRSQVLLIEGDARWEFRYLDAAFSRDKRVELKRVLFRQPYLGVLPDTFFPRQLEAVAPENVAPNEPMPADPDKPAKPDNPRETTPFDNIDLVVLGDVSPDRMTDAVWQQLRTFVSQGGTLVISAGKRFMPFGHRSEVLNQLLPISDAKPFVPEASALDLAPSLRGWPLQLTVDGEAQAMLQFAPDVLTNRSIWKSLPGQTYALLGNAKPGASVWAYIPFANPGTNPDEAVRKSGVIIHQHLGAGQVLWIGCDGTWRWRHRVGDTYHHRFWGQLASWAAANRVTGGNEFVRFGVDRSDVELGQSVIIRAKWLPTFLRLHPNIKARADVFQLNAASAKPRGATNADGKRTEPKPRPFTSIDLTPGESSALQFEGKLNSLPTGEYRLALIVEGADLGSTPVETDLYVHDHPSAELSDISANRDLLTQLADVSGGRLFQPDELADLPKQFKPYTATQSLYQEEPLWDRWPWLILIFALLTTEWVIRKLNGLP